MFKRNVNEFGQIMGDKSVFNFFLLTIIIHDDNSEAAKGVKNQMKISIKLFIVPVKFFLRSDWTRAYRYFAYRTMLL